MVELTRMGSVKYRMAEARRNECNVVLVGDVRVGKSALVNRFINNKFTEAYRATGSTCEKMSTSTMVGSHRLKFTIWDTTGSHAVTSSRAFSYREADVFLLCYKISEPSSLFNAINHWFSEVRSVAPVTPIVLVGCQSDTRKNREILANLSKQGRAPISPEQALTFSQQIGACMYVETTAKVAKTTIGAFEAAGLAFLGKNEKRTPSPKPRRISKYSSTSPGNSLERSEESSSSDEITDSLWDRLASPKLHRSISEVPSLHSSRSASLSSKSIPSISSLGSKTPKNHRKNSMKTPEKTMTIKCQRLTADRTYEEIEVEVPVPIYETIQLYNDSTGSVRQHKERRSLGSKLRNLFVRND